MAKIVGWQMLWFSGPEFIPNYKKSLQRKKDTILAGNNPEEISIR